MNVKTIHGHMYLVRETIPTQRRFTGRSVTFLSIYDCDGTEDETILFFNDFLGQYRDWQDREFTIDKLESVNIC